MRLSDTLTLVTVDVTEPGVGLSTVYEVECEACGNTDVFEQRSAAMVYGPGHVCGAVVS